jgi:HlyD family secretion protein
MRRFKPLLWVVLLIAVFAGITLFVKRRKAAAEAPTYRTGLVERRDIVVAVSAVGVLEPLTTVEVKASVAGEIVELAVDRGDWVKRGDLIAKIDPTETRTAYEQAQADVTAARARIQEATSELDRQRHLAPAQVQAAMESLAAADARAEQAAKTLEFQKKQTDADIRRAQQALETTRARLEQAKARAEAQPELTQASVAQADAELQAAQESRKRLTEATHPQERAAAKAAMDAAKVSVDNAQKALERLQRLCKNGFVAPQEVENAETSLADGKDRYETAKAAYDALDQKQSTEVQEAQARVRQAQASLNSANANRMQVGIAKQDLKAAEAAVHEAEAALAAAEANREQDAARLQDVRAAQAAVKQARAQLTVAQANTAQTTISGHQAAQARAQAKRSEAQLENAEKNLSYTTIAAPRDGLVIDRFVEEGTVITSGRSTITQGTSIVTLADVSRMFVLAESDEADIGQVKLGQPVDIEVETFPDRLFQGRVVQVYPKGEEVENVTIFRVRIEVAKPHDKLRPGMTAESSIIRARRDNVVAVPNEALFEQEGKTFAEIIKDGKSQRVEVAAGLASFEWTEVTAGLQEGQEVVLGTAEREMGGGPGGPGAGRGGSRGGERGDARSQMRRMQYMGGGGPRGGR